MRVSAISTLLASLFFLALFVPASHAAVCDKEYFWQHGAYFSLTGSTAANLTQESAKTVGKDLKGIEILHAETEYAIITRFKGNSACTAWKQTTIDLASRKKGMNEFMAESTNSWYIRLLSTPYPGPGGTDYEYWFGFADGIVNDVAQLVDAIGKFKSSPNHLHVWYGAATMTKQIKDKELGTLKGTLVGYHRSSSSNPDSATLLKGLMDSWKGETSNDTQTVSFKVQMLKVTYDSMPPPAGIRQAAAKNKGAFHASQSGAQVLIRPAEGKASGEALGLFNMMGHRIATLHPTGYLYLWNGRTASGARAPTGVYFVQSGSRILGKFFYRD